MSALDQQHDDLPAVEDRHRQQVEDRDRDADEAHEVEQVLEAAARRRARRAPRSRAVRRGRSWRPARGARSCPARDRLAHHVASCSARSRRSARPGRSAGRPPRRRPILPLPPWSRGTTVSVRSPVAAPHLDAHLLAGALLDVGHEVLRVGDRLAVDARRISSPIWKPARSAGPPGRTWETRGSTIGIEAGGVAELVARHLARHDLDVEPLGPRARPSSATGFSGAVIIAKADVLPARRPAAVDLDDAVAGQQPGGGGRGLGLDGAHDRRDLLQVGHLDADHEDDGDQQRWRARCSSPARRDRPGRAASAAWRRNSRGSPVRRLGVLAAQLDVAAERHQRDPVLGLAAAGSRTRRLPKPSEKV